MSSLFFALVFIGISWSTGKNLKFYFMCIHQLYYPDMAKQNPIQTITHLKTDWPNQGSRRMKPFYFFLFKVVVGFRISAVLSLNSLRRAEIQKKFICLNTPHKIRGLLGSVIECNRTVH